MVKKLRKKFIITAFLAVAALLFAILTTINVVNFAVVTANADEITEMIAGRMGAFNGEAPMPMNAGQPLKEEGFDKNFGNERFGPSSPETRASTRYFTVTISPEGNATLVDYKMTDGTVTQEEAIAWAETLKNKKAGWTKTTFRYRVSEEGDGIAITVVDQSRELGPSFRVLWASLIGFFGGLLVTFLALLPISKIVVSPIEANDRKQKRFISDAAFELKTPLSVIDTNRRIIELDVGERKETKAIGSEVGYLMDFTKKLDTLVRLETEPGKEDFKTFDLSGLCREIAAPYADLFTRNGKTLEIHVQDGLTLFGDVVKISELLNVCLENALGYSDGKATFTAQGKEDRVSLTFTNDAKNVPDGELDSVFEKFYRSQDVRESGIEGAGIGLSIAKDVVDIHKGRIMARGENGSFELKIEL